MSSTLVFILVGAMLLYILYLRVQIYINQRIISAFQASAVVVPPGKQKSDPRVGLLAVGLLLLAVGVFTSLVR